MFTRFRMKHSFCKEIEGNQVPGPFMSERLRLLLVEDSPHDTQLIVRELLEGGFQVISERVDTAAAMKTALQTQIWDLIISDYSLPQFSGADALAMYRAAEVGAPFIIVSGVVGEDRAVEMVKAGAHDYVMKDRLQRLVPAVRNELRAAEERRVRKGMEDTVAFLASLVESCDDAIVGKDLDGKIVSWNSGAERLYGYAAQEIVGRAVSILVPSCRPEEESALLDHLRKGQYVEPYETVRVRKDGSLVEVSLAMSPIKDRWGQVIGASAVARDITRRKEEENERVGLIQELTAALAHGCTGESTHLLQAGP